MSGLPPVYKSLQNLYKLSGQFEKRDVTTAYWTRLHCVQEAMKIDSKSKEGRVWLMTQMDWLESVKKANPDKEEITNEIVGQAHCENVALGVFARADKMDRDSQFSINLVKLFYTSSQLMEMLVQFGEISEDFQEKKKYAKWKTLNIKQCLDAGEMPVPGPPGGFVEEEADEFEVPGPSHAFSPPSEPPRSYESSHIQETVDNVPAAPVSYSPEPVAAPRSTGGFEPNAEQVARAQKLAKFAVSSLDYDDVQGAIDMLNKSLNVLRTGKE